MENKYFEKFCIRYIDDNTYFYENKKSNVTFTVFDDYPSDEMLKKAIAIGRYFEVVKIFTYHN